MGYFVNGAFFPGNRIIPKVREYSDIALLKELEEKLRMMKERDEQEDKFFEELNTEDKFI